MERGPAHRIRNSRIVVSVFIGLVLMYLLVFMPLPMFIFQPGTADPIKPMVRVKGGDAEEKGAFMLTTVRVSDASITSLLVAMVHPYEDIYFKKDIFKNGENEREYTQRQEIVMQSSQMNAIQAAYRKLNIPFHIQNDGLVVVRTLPGYPAEKELIAGDSIVKINQDPVKSSAELNELMKSKKPGNTIVVTYKRKGEEKAANLTLTALPAEKDANGNVTSERAGLGIVPADVQSIKADQDGKQVKIKAGEIGGPSAGLMFSLEIYNKLTPGDLSKGYRIAGTGTISAKGTVGSIGGIEHKIIAASKAKADIFFAPKDETAEASGGTPARNYSDAKKRADDIHTKMKIVPVGTLDEAIAYLQQLEPKS
ncbi:SepM family pheromone-processing serine protease [Paenibacillus thalictri]|uniref:endopeptidase La n=1 Tax=Paenibacillus thalictri TaxID=2527873 RepID=A0A4Q9DS23_9BACL|nr:SepM family pheromone-processing serine protease [Paenibacillus thalictri]TBL77685.1 PDZ domain-containing protein [Paenibacillus thalictri]